MLATNYPLLDIFWTMLEIFLFVIWIWLLIVVFTDIFRSHDMGGAAKAIWVILIVIFPYIGVLVYLIARGGKMHERAEAQAQQAQSAFDAYVKQAAGTSWDQHRRSNREARRSEVQGRDHRSRVRGGKSQGARLTPRGPAGWAHGAHPAADRSHPLVGPLAF